MNARRLAGYLLPSSFVALAVLGSYAQPRQAGAAAGVDSPMLQALRWRSIGPARGGRSIASTGVKGRPLEGYFGAVGGGLWKTTDGGTTWNPVTDGQIRSSSVGAVAVSDSNPDVVYIGMGESCIRGNIMQGDGIYKSVDGGQKWQHVGLADSQAISKIRIHPKNPDLVYAAAFGHPSGPNDERGVFRSRDGGRTWQRVLFRDDKTAAIDLSMDPRNPDVLYAALWEAYRITWQMSSGGPGSGLFKSTDGGDTWTELTRKPGMPAGVIGRIGVSVSGADSNRVYALVENENGGMFVSDSGGETWTRVNDDRNLRQRAFYYTHIAADPRDRDTVYVLNTGFYKSTDGGKTYRTFRAPHGDHHDLWIDPDNPAHLVNGNDGGGNVSFNGAETWTDQDFPTAQFYHVTTTRDVPYHVCGAQQDNSTACISSQGGGRGGAAPIYAVGGGESGYIAPHPTDPDIFYAGSQGALLTRFDRRTGYLRDVQVYPRFFSGEPASALKERWQWTFPIVFSPHDPGVLYTSSQHLWKTTDGGQSWERISPDLTRADPKTLGHSGGPITGDMNGPEIYATIFAVAPSRLEKDTIWTGSDDGLIHVTRDGGRNWANVTPKDLPEFARVSIIDASSHRPGTAYFAAKRYLNDDRAPYIYRTDDYGRTWTKIVAGIRADDYAHVVREDPVTPGLLYAGTEHGVYVSFDNGAAWQSLSQNLPDTQVSDLVVEGNDLVIGTHGRSFYIMDDVAPLRQMQKALTTDAYLFKPDTVIRSLDQGVIYYALRKPAAKVTIDILDGRGTVIRTFTADRAREQERGRGRGSQAAEGGGGGRGAQPQPPLTNAGLTRFVWDLRYPGATTFEGMILWSGTTNGPVAVPGQYQVRLTADGMTPQTQSFEIRRNPQYADVSDADLQAQFDLSMKIRDKVSEANQAVIQIRDFKSQVGQRLEKAGPKADARLKSATDALVKALSAVEENIYQVRNRSGQDPLNFPIKLNNRLAALLRSVMAGDGKPTAGSHVVFKELSEELAVETKALAAAVADQLPRVNSELRRLQLEPIAPAQSSTAPASGRGR